MKDCAWIAVHMPANHSVHSETAFPILQSKIPARIDRELPA